MAPRCVLSLILVLGLLAITACSPPPSSGKPRRQGPKINMAHFIKNTPTYKGKISKKDWGISKIDISAKLRTLGVNVTSNIKKKLDDLTYGECDDFATDLANAGTQFCGSDVLVYVRHALLN